MSRTDRYCSTISTTKHHFPTKTDILRHSKHTVKRIQQNTQRIIKTSLKKIMSSPTDAEIIQTQIPRVYQFLSQRRSYRFTGKPNIISLPIRGHAHLIGMDNEYYHVGMIYHPNLRPKIIIGAQQRRYRRRSSHAVHADKAEYNLAFNLISLIAPRHMYEILKSQPPIDNPHAPTIQQIYINHPPHSLHAQIEMIRRLQETTPQIYNSPDGEPKTPTAQPPIYFDDPEPELSSGEKIADNIEQYLIYHGNKLGYTLWTYITDTKKWYIQQSYFPARPKRSAICVT